MQKRFLFSGILLTFMVSGLKAQTQTGSSVEKQVQAMLSKMTLSEKVGQMVDIGLPALFKGGYWDARDTAIIDTAKLAYFVGKYGVGAIHNTPGYPPGNREWFRLIRQIQNYAMKHTRLGIPVLYGIDDINGANFVMGSTLLPHEITLAATWNPALEYQAGQITAYESRSASLPWSYSPNVDVATQPLWGRIGESSGEDPYLISQMTGSYIRGAQAGGLGKNTSIAVCVKHYLGYGAAINGKDRGNALIPENYLRQYFIPPFQSAIRNGAMSVMVSSNAVNGIPCHINKYYITNILKGELGFKGVVVSDFSDIQFLVDAHQVAANMREATKMVINAGLDMSMHPFDAKLADIIIDLVKKGEIPMSRINDAVTRILRLKYSLNLFKDPYNNPSEYPKFGSKEFVNDNYNMACEAITLLKNDHVLPLARHKRILVTGYTANSLNCLEGAWSRTFLGQDTKYNDPSKKTILEAIQSMVGVNNVDYVQGTGYLKDINTDEAVARAKNDDYIVACLGEIPATEKPSDINELPIPEAQQNLVKKLATTGKPIILVLVEGRPRIIKDIEPLVKGVVMAYIPGDEGGRAVASILFGDKNPCGKLPYTYPKYTGNTLVYWHKMTDIRDVNWGFNGFYPQYQFGFGLSYTTFEYSDITLNTKHLTGEDSLVVSVTVKNTGTRQGKETVECYIRDLVASVSPDVLKLVRFEKVRLNPGESKIVHFTINRDDLAFVGADKKWITEPGQFKVFVGGNPEHMKSELFDWTK